MINAFRRDHRPTPGASARSRNSRLAPIGPARLNEAPIVCLKTVVLGLAGCPRARASYSLREEGHGRVA